MTVHTPAPAVAPPEPAPSRAERLRAATHPTHEALDSAIMAARPFDSVPNYARFLKVQHAFHADVAPLYERDELRALLPDLDARCRLDAVRQDAQDLGVTLEPAGPAAAQQADTAQALGWLYVVEGSNLGAAFLFKAAKKMGLSETHGARHLSEAPEGRAAQWRSFKDALNAAELSAEDEDRCITAAEAAFARVRELTARHLA